MISICKMEWYKLWHRKSFLILLAFLLLFNIAYLGYTQFINNSIPLSSYQKIEQKLDSMPNADRYTYIKEYRERLQAYEIISQIKKLQANGNEDSTRQLSLLRSQYPEIEQHYPNGDKEVDLQFSNRYDIEVQLLNVYYNEWHVLHQYPSYLEGIQQRAIALQRVSIFQDGDAYSQQNIEKTAHDYQKLKDISIMYTSEKGILAALSPVTSILLLIILFAISTYLIIEEKERDLFSIIRTTPYGNFVTIFSKLLVLSFSILLISCTFFIINLWMMNELYGLGDLSRSLQSLASYSKCALHLDVKSFLILFLSLKWVTLWCLGIIIMIASLVFKNRHTSIAIILLLLLGSYVCTTVLNANGPFKTLYYCNFFTLLQSERLLQQYVNFQIFNCPLSLWTLATTTIVFLTIGTCTFCNVVYIKKQTLRNFAATLPSFRKKHSISLSLWKQECYKFLWLQRVLLIILLCIGFQYLQVSQSKLYKERNETFFIQYLSDLKGPYTKEKENYLHREKSRYESLHQQLQSIQENYTNGVLNKIEMEQMSSPIEAQLSSEACFQEVLDYAEYVKVDDAREFVMYLGHMQLLRSRTFLFIPAILLLVVLTFALSNLFTFDYQYQIQVLLACTPKGRKQIFQVKIGCIFLTTFVFYSIAYIPSFLQISQSYGLSSWQASITSIPAFANAPSSITILHLYLLTHGLRFFAFFCYGCIISFFAVKTRQHLLAMFIGFLLFLLPLLLSFIHLSSIEAISLFPMIMPFATTSRTIFFCFAGYGLCTIRALIIIYRHHIS